MNELDYEGWFSRAYEIAQRPIKEAEKRQGRQLRASAIRTQAPGGALLSALTTLGQSGLETRTDLANKIALSLAERARSEAMTREAWQEQARRISQQQEFAKQQMAQQRQWSIEDWERQRNAPLTSRDWISVLASLLGTAGQVAGGYMAYKPQGELYDTILKYITGG